MYNLIYLHIILEVLERLFDALYFRAYISLEIRFLVIEVKEARGIFTSPHFAAVYRHQISYIELMWSQILARET